MVAQTKSRWTENHSNTYNKSYMTNRLKEPRPLIQRDLNKQHIPQKQSECFVCRQPIVLESREDGIEYDENNINVHADCFECTICGAKLLASTNSPQGNFDTDGAPHLLMDGRFYCEMHGVQRKQILSDNDKPAMGVNKKTPARANKIIQLNNNIAGSIENRNNTSFCWKPANTVHPNNANLTETQFIGNVDSSKHFRFGNSLKTDSNQWKSKSAQRADMVMADAKTPIRIQPRNELFATQRSDALSPRKYKDFTKNEPINLQQKAKSIQETLQNSQFIQDLKRNLVNRTQKIEENDETSNYRYADGKPLNNINLHEKPPRKSIIPANNRNSELHQTKKFAPKFNLNSNEDGTVDINLGAKASNLIDKFVKDCKLGNSDGSPLCVQCRKKICGSYVLANGKTYCPDHFTCANCACNRGLLDCGFLECENGENYCRKCYNMLIAPSCHNCRLPIIEDCLNALQKDWHPSCFVCTHCRKPFKDNLSFYLENNLPYCEEDWNELFTNKCAKCVRPIKTGECFIEALDRTYHAKCFQCENCHLCLEDETFYARNGKPYCAAHRK